MLFSTRESRGLTLRIIKHVGSVISSLTAQNRKNLIFSDYSDKFTLNLDLVGSKDSCLIIRIGRLECNSVMFFSKSFSVTSVLSINATIIFPFSAVSHFSIIAVSPSKIPASIMDSPSTSSA